jgi:ABC-2 type transport system ATP-binding protein
MTEVLEVVGARKHFGATRALDGAELSLGRGECLGLLGPNGAGKTTLVRSITGRVRLDKGRITLLGAALDGPDTNADEARRRLGVVPQEVAVYPLLTARENLEVFAALHGVASSEIRGRVAWALEWTGLADRADEPTKCFSGGMKRRLNIACGIMHRPEVVLLDEPTVGVDPQSRQRIWEMLGQLQSDGASLLLTTHQLDEAEHVCQRIVIIDHGRAIAAGTLQALIDQTIGRGRQVTLALDETPGQVPWPRTFPGCWARSTSGGSRFRTCGWRRRACTRSSFT